MRDVYEDHLAIENLEEPYHAYGMTLIRMIYNTVVSKLGETPCDVEG